jgi:hypothetical protein
MKKMPLLLKPFPLLTLTIFCLAASCQKPEKIDCSGYPDEYWEISPDAQWKIPYTGTDTLVFLHRTGTTEDTITFIGQGKRYYNEYEDGGSAGDPCRWLITKEAYEIIFKSDKPGSDIKFNIVAAGEDKWDGIFSFIFRNVLFESTLWSINNPVYGGYIDEIEFEGKMYYNVSYFGRYPPGQHGTGVLSKMYYTVEEGVVRFEFGNGSDIWQNIK